MRKLFLYIATTCTVFSYSQDQKNAKKVSKTEMDVALQHELEIIYDDDQQIRQAYRDLQKSTGFDNPELTALGVKMNKIDSLNTIKVLKILDSKGWIGPDVVGSKGNQALFLVIQHADIATQKKYLPMMQKAARSKNASLASLALLEDRIALREGKHQIYGSQISRHPSTNEFYVLPLIDPDNVDIRRAEMNLGPIAEYVDNWKIVWDVKQYKASLPEYEKILRDKQME